MSSPEDDAFSPTNGILLADISRGVPIVSLKEKRTELKGHPYSTCHKHTDSGLAPGSPLAVTIELLERK